MSVQLLCFGCLQTKRSIRIFKEVTYKLPYLAKQAFCQNIISYFYRKIAPPKSFKLWRYHFSRFCVFCGEQLNFGMNDWLCSNLQMELGNGLHKETTQSCVLQVQIKVWLNTVGLLPPATFRGNGRIKKLFQPLSYIPSIPK